MDPAFNFSFIRNRSQNLRQLMLQWERDQSNRLIIKSVVPRGKVDIEATNNVSWEHLIHDELRLTDIEDILLSWKSFGLPESELDLTRRLLHRVAITNEKTFIGGKFLVPHALRYDLTNKSKYSVDRICLFLSFPYFSIAKPQKRNAYQRDSKNHPIRALFQTQNRLIDTDERDYRQSIKKLKGRNLAECMEVSERDVLPVQHEFVNEIIHVPQLWALNLGSNKLVTVAPMSEVDLLGPNIMLTSAESIEVLHPCRFIRISFQNGPTLEQITYPIDQCASWFGLLNKHQRIKQMVEEKREFGVSREYRFYVGEHIIECTTWASVQHLAADEILDLAMVENDPSLYLDPSTLVSDYGLYSSINRDSSNDTPLLDDTEIAILDPVPVVSPLLAWSAHTRPYGAIHLLAMKQLLSDIYTLLPDTCVGSGPERRNSLNDVQSRSKPRIGRRPNIMIKRKSALEVVNDCQGSQPRMDFYEGMEKLLAYFISNEVIEDSPLLGLFWGAAYELLNHPRRMSKLLQMLEKINLRSRHLHCGVHHKRIIIEPHGQAQQDTISEAATLLPSIIDAFGEVFEMIIHSVREARHTSETNRGGAKQFDKTKMLKTAKNACSLLENAKDELVSNSIGIPSGGENIGPVLTPQNLLILHMERLVRGVYGSSNVDIMSILEASLAQLALKVSSGASRRLLITLNSFEEEVSIVESVLKQQMEVLQQLRQYLDPSSARRPTVAQRIRFKNEERAIENLQFRIREQTASCPELRSRAKALAVQNVQLIETQQDANSRAILIFTTITVLFVPLSFVASFFGMNVVGINPTTSTTTHFWIVALPLTGGVIALSAFILLVGEEPWAAATFLMLRLWGKAKFHRRAGR